MKYFFSNSLSGRMTRERTYKGARYFFGASAEASVMIFIFIVLFVLAPLVLK